MNELRLTASYQLIGQFIKVQVAIAMSKGIFRIGVCESEGNKADSAARVSDVHVRLKLESSGRGTGSCCFILFTNVHRRAKASMV